MIFRFCFDVTTWQCKRNKKFIATCPEGSYFSLFLDQKRWHKILSKHLCWERVDLQHFCNCEDEIRNMIVYHSSDDYHQDISWFEYLTKKMFFSHEVCWKDPHCEYLPACLPQMYFESCSIFCGTYGCVNPPFSLPDDSVILLWNPGSYHRIFFMFMSQLYPHYKEFQVNKWKIIAFSTETSGAIRKTTVDPPVNIEMVPPHPPVGADGNDPIHPDDYGPPPEDDVNMPPGGGNDSGEQDEDSEWDMDDPNLEPPPSEQPPFPPHPPPSMHPSMPSVVVPIPQQPVFSNPDETIEQVMQPVADEESSSEEPHITEPERVELKQREVSHDSDEKPPKAKAKVQIKKQKVQLPGHQNPIEAPTVKRPKNEEDDEPHPNASSSNDPTIPLPTTTPHSFTPAQPEDEAESDTPQSSQDTIPYQDVETEEPIITEDDVEHLNSRIR